MPGIVDSVQGLAGPVSAYCDWVRQQVGSTSQSGSTYNSSLGYTLHNARRRRNPEISKHYPSRGNICSLQTCRPQKCNTIDFLFLQYSCKSQSNKQEEQADGHYQDSILFLYESRWNSADSREQGIKSKKTQHCPIPSHCFLITKWCSDNYGEIQVNIQ